MPTRVTTRPGSGTGYGLKIRASTMLKGVEVIPMPNASVITTSAVSPDVRRRLRMAYLTSIRGDAQVVNYLARRLVEAKAITPAILPAGPSGR